MSCHQLLTSRNSFSLTLLILLFCLSISNVASVGESWTCELLNVTVSQRWIGNTLLETPESRAIQSNLQNVVDLTTLGSDHWSCFETETTSGILGTPGGDTSEFLLALSVLLQDSPLLNSNQTNPSTNNTSNNTSPSPSPLDSSSETSFAYASSFYNFTQLFQTNYSVDANISQIAVTEVPSNFSTAVGNATYNTYSGMNQTSVYGNASVSDSGNVLNVSVLLSQVLPPLNVSLNLNFTNTNDSLDNSTSSVDISPTYLNSSSFVNGSDLYSSDYSYPTLNITQSDNMTEYNTTTQYNITQSVSASGNVTVPPPVITNSSSILNPALFKRVHEIFDAFVKINISSSRRFYYHTDYDIVEQLRKRFALRTRDVFYDMLTPEQQSEAIALVIQPENIGCKHLLQILQNPTVYRTPTILTQTFLQVLHNYLWNHNNGTYFSKFYVDIAKRTHPVEIAHLNVSINVIAHPELETNYDQTETTANPCLRVQPTVPTLIGNESYFVVQHRGISVLRKKLAEYTASLPEAKLTQQQTYDKIEELAGIQWALSQSKLGPNLKTFDVIVHTQNRTGEVVERTWLFVGIGVIAAALVAYLGYLYWKRRSEASKGERLFDEETPSEGSEKYPIRVDNVYYSGNSKNT